MNFEPQKFFIGLVDFFSTILPGALAVYVGKDWALRQLDQGFDTRIDGPEAVAVFVFASYLVGHFIFLIGAKLLDDYVYDPLRNATTRRQAERLVKGKYLSFRPVRWIASRSLFFGRKADDAVQLAVYMKSRYFEGTTAAEAINAFQWCKARLSKEHPEGLATIQRFEADSKFFRSFSVILFVLAVTFAAQRRPFLWTATAAVLLLLALWRYIEQRFKSTQHAYWYVLTLRDGDTLVPRPHKDGITHAGGVVFKRDKGDGNTIKYLLVTAKKDSRVWVLPKGHIEPGEEPEETAVREVREESGHWACPTKLYKDVTLTSGDREIRVRFFLMEHLQAPWPRKRRTWRKNRCGERQTDEDRRREWLDAAGAAARLGKETGDLFAETQAP